MEFKGTAKLAYYKDNCEEELMATPISVLRYISILETHIEESKAPEMLKMLSDLVNLFKRGEFDTDENIGGKMLIKAQQLIKETTEL
jgi:hypothetical protein